ncbi:MAG: hypothetical protein AAB515_00145 [Patescibacteria group bacterium]
MNIAILGKRQENQDINNIAILLGKELSMPDTEGTHARPARIPGNKILVTGAGSGTSEAVRKGAFESSLRHVTTHYIHDIHTSVLSRWTENDGYYTKRHGTSLERSQFVSSASTVICLDINRGNIGTILCLLNEQRSDATLTLTRQPLPRLLLLWNGCFGAINTRPSLPKMQAVLGPMVDEIDAQAFVSFQAAADALEHIKTFAKTSNGY